MPLTDKDAKRAYHREYMKQRLAKDTEFREHHHARIKRNNERYRLEIDGLIREFRASGCCICGEREEVCLVAHHVDGTTKTRNVADMRWWRNSPKRVQDELDKCVCLCANCHLKVHAGLIALSPARAVL